MTLSSRCASLAAALAAVACCAFRLRLSAGGQRTAAGGAGAPLSVAQGSLHRFLARVRAPAQELRRELCSRAREDSTASIEVTKDLVEQRTLSVTATNIPTEYELTYTVTFAVQGTDKELLAPQTISLSKDLQLR